MVDTFAVSQKIKFVFRMLKNKRQNTSFTNIFKCCVNLNLNIFMHKIIKFAQPSQIQTCYILYLSYSEGDELVVLCCVF